MNNQQFLGFFMGNYFFKSEPKNVVNLYRFKNKKFFSIIKRCVEINLVILFTWIRIRIRKIFWIRIQSIRIHITDF